MKVITETDAYTIYQRRDERYAIRDCEHNWVNGDAKVAILIEQKLIEVVARKPAPEPAAEEEAASDGSADDVAPDLEETASPEAG